MAVKPRIQKEIREAEKRLRTTEEELGEDHIKVSYCLDECAGLYREHKIRLLDAANMEARAQAIRKKHFKKEMESEDPEQARRTGELVKVYNAMQRKKEREASNRKAMKVALGAILITGLVGALGYLQAKSPSQSLNINLNVSKLLPGGSR